MATPDLREYLDKLDQEGEELAPVTEWLIKRKTLYLSGAPYLWTAYGERAFVFATNRMCRDLIERYPEELKGARPVARRRDREQQSVAA